MKSITAKGKATEIAKIEGTYKSNANMTINETFTLVTYYYGEEKVIITGVVNENHEDQGKKYLEVFRQACIQVIPESELIIE